MEKPKFTRMENTGPRDRVKSSEVEPLSKFSTRSRERQRYISVAREGLHRGKRKYEASGRRQNERSAKPCEGSITGKRTK